MPAGRESRTRVVWTPWIRQFKRAVVDVQAHVPKEIAVHLDDDAVVARADERGDRVGSHFAVGNVHETRSDAPTGVMYDSTSPHHDANTCEGVVNPRYWFVYEFCKNTIFCVTRTTKKMSDER